MADVGSIYIGVRARTAALEKDLRQATRMVENFAGKSVAAAIAPSQRLMRVLGGAAAAAGAAMSVAVGFAIRAAARLEQTEVAFETLLGSAERAKDFLADLQELAAQAATFRFEGLAQSAQQLLAFRFEAEEVLPMLERIGDAVAAMGGSQEMIDRIVRAFGQIRAKGRLQGEELLQLAEANINAYEYLAEAMGMTVPQAMEAVRKGAVDYRMAINAILRGMEKDFAGAMERQSRTIPGLWSSIADSVGIIAAQFGKHLIETFRIRDMLDAVSRRLSTLASVVAREGWAKAWARVAPPWVTPVLLGIAGAIAGALVPALTALAARLWLVAVRAWLAMVRLWPYMAVGAAIAVAAWVLARHWEAAWSAIGAAALYGASFVVRAVALTLSSIGLFVPSVKGVAKAASDLADALRASAVNMWASARSSVAAAQQAAKSQAGVSQAGKKAADSQNNLAEGMENVAKAAADNIQSFDEVHQIQEEMAESPAATMPEMELPEVGTLGLPSLGTLAADIAGTVSSTWQKAVETITSAWEQLKAKALGTFPWIQSMIEGANRAIQWAKDNWPTLRPILEGLAGVLIIVGLAWLFATHPVAGFILAGLGVAALVAVIIGKWKELEPVLGPIWQRIWAVVGPIWDTMKRTAKTVFEEIYRTVLDVWNRIKAFWQQWGPVIMPIVEGVWRQIGIVIGTAINLVKDVIGFVLSIIRGDWESAWNYVLDFGRTIWNLIVETWNNLKQTASEVWPAIKDKLLEVWDGIKQAALEKWEALKASILERWEAIRQRTAEIWGSITGWLGEKWDSIRSKAADVWAGIKNWVLTHWDEIYSSTTGIWNRITTWLRDTWNSLVQKAADFGRRIMESIKNAIGSVRLPIPTISIEWRTTALGIKIPDLDIGVNWRTLRDLVPWLAEGGVVDRPMIAGLGERGPEAVLPLTGAGGLVDAIEQAVERGSYSGTFQGIRVASLSNQGGAPQEVILRIDGATFARLILPAIIKEGQRQGLQLVVRPTAGAT